MLLKIVPSLQAIVLLLFAFIALPACGSRQVMLAKPIPHKPVSIPEKSIVEPIKKPLEETVMVASWYGKPFHGRQTASGDIYNMYDMTAAHKTLPFGTILQVANATNDKSVEVVVNDRGPYIDGRDIDLSYGAAKEIGIVGPGVGPVRISFLGRDKRYVKTYKYRVARPNSRFTIQVGAFKESDNAERLAQGLKFSYSKVYVKEATVNGEQYFRVRLGVFSQKGQAITLAKQLAEEGYPAVIMSAD
jgi:rare lipoprotein A